jgi:AcrR family transcriptional regulator
MIVAGAIQFFAEHGFAGGTAELASRLGITQPLLYRYFPSKDALIERVYADIYHATWDPAWDRVIKDRRAPLRERLIRFYTAYSATMMSYERVRLFLFSGLNGLGFGHDYFEELEDRVIKQLARAVNREIGVSARVAPRKEIVEAVWGLHAAIFYVAFQRWVYSRPAQLDMPAMIELKVELFLEGISALRPLSNTPSAF